MTGSEGDGYATLAGDYHWLGGGKSDVVAVLTRHAHQLGEFGPDAKILDCACGIGTDAVALAERGHRVWASDGSGAMVAEARRLVARAGVAVPVEECLWDDLPRCFGERFDLVLCLGNSISHLPGDGMLPAFRGMAEVLREGGNLILNARNWEKLRREQPRLTFPDRVVERQGQRCVPVYVWSYGTDWEDAHHVEIIFVVDTSGRLTVSRHELTFWPFRATDVQQRLETAGFHVLATDYDAEGDWYEVVAEKA